MQESRQQIEALGAEIRDLRAWNPMRSARLRAVTVRGGVMSNRLTSAAVRAWREEKSPVTAADGPSPDAGGDSTALKGGD